MKKNRNFRRGVPMRNRLFVLFLFVLCVFVGPPSAYSMERLWCRDAEVIVKNNVPALKFNKWFGEDASYKVANAYVHSTDCNGRDVTPWDVYGAGDIINFGFDMIRPDIPSKSPNTNSGLVLYGENYDGLQQNVAPMPLAACVYRFSATIFAFSKGDRDDRQFCAKFLLYFDRDGLPIVAKIEK